MMQLNRFLAVAIKIGTYVILFLPLVVFQGMFFPFITGKNFIFRIIIEIIFASWVVLFLRDKSYLPKRSLIFYFVLASVAVLTLATIFGADVSRSFWSNFERMEGLLGHLHLLMYFLVLVGINRTEKDWWRFFHVSFIASLFVGGYAIFQLAGVNEIHQGGTRIDATLGNATYLAVYMLFHVFLALYYFLKSQKNAWRILYAALFLFDIFFVYQTATRGAVLGLFGGLFLSAIVFSFSAGDKRWRNFSYGAITLMVALAFIFYFAKDSKFITESTTLARVRNISIASDDAQARFHIWSMSFKAFKERPILGWGPENFAVVFSKHYDPRLWSREPWFDRAHNAVFDWLIQGGILGLISYLGIFASSIWLLFKKFSAGKTSNIELSVFGGFLAGYFFQNLFVFDQLTSYILIFAILAYLNFLVAKDNATQALTLKFSQGAQYVWSAAIFIALLSSIYVFNIKPILANASLLSALSSANSGNFEEAQNEFKRAIDLSPLGRREAREQYSYFATLIASRQEIPEAIRKSSLDEAIREAKLQTEDSPLDARSALFLGSVYDAAGRSAEAFEAFKKAQELSPKKQQIIFLVAQHYIQQQNFDKAIELAKTAADLDRTYADAVKNLISFEVYAGKNDLARDEISRALDSGMASAEDLKNWGSIAVSRKNFTLAGELYMEAIKLAPNDIQLLINLAATYYDAGRPDLAIAEIRKAIALEPQFKDQGEVFIKEIMAGKKPK